MPTPRLPAASLRPQIRLPARRVLPRASNYLICHALSSIRVAILRAESNFLPALREAGTPDVGSVDREVPCHQTVFEDAPAPVTPSPLLGEHTTEVFGEWLDLSAGDVATLRGEGVV